VQQLEQVREQLAGALIALDFDGTLAPVVDRPEDARALPAAAAALRVLAREVRCLAVITGRPAGFVVAQLELDAASPVIVLGGYGRERWQAGVLAAPEVPAAVRAACRELAALAAAGPDGTRLEDKGSGIALHVRQTREPLQAMAELEPEVRAVAHRHGLTVEAGRLVLEVRPAGVDKGLALLGLVDEQLPAAVLFAGDDLGDLAAFDAVEQLRARGLPGVTVCSGSAEVPELADRADLVVAGPEGVAELLRALVPPAAD
jgi:trehalose 6-phosphate phosphatase